MQLRAKVTTALRLAMDLWPGEIKRLDWSWNCVTMRLEDEPIEKYP